MRQNVALCRNGLNLSQTILSFNPLPYNKFLDRTKLNAFADVKLNVAKTISVIDRAVNIVGKGENAGDQHFLLFSQCFP